MFSITDGTVVLRDFKKSDISKRVFWETEETEWQKWDAPWEYEGLTELEKQQELVSYIERMNAWPEKLCAMPDSRTRFSLQICTKSGDYIGWCNSYRIDDGFSFSDKGACTVGIDIPETSERKKGYGFRALCLFIDYLSEHGETEIYTQTWSGNVRMISLAQKLGFRECCRKKGIRSVRNALYDGLTFHLDRESYEKAKKDFFERAAGSEKCRID